MSKTKILEESIQVILQAVSRQHDQVRLFRADQVSYEEFKNSYHKINDEISREFSALDKQHYPKNKHTFSYCFDPFWNDPDNFKESVDKVNRDAEWGINYGGTD